MTQRWDPDAYDQHARFVSDLGAPVVDLLEPLAGERVLDLGCGDGSLTERLRRAGCLVVAVDSSPEQVWAALERGLDARSPERTFAVADHSVSTLPNRTLDSSPTGRQLAGRLVDDARELGIETFGIDDPGQGIVHNIAPETGLAQPGMLIGCGDSHEILRCDNNYETTTNHKHPTGFAQLGRQLVEDCGGCHSSEEPVFGYDFSTLQTAYESARYKVEFIYPQLVSGDMPKYSDPYDAEKLKSIRTCLLYTSPSPRD